MELESLGYSVFFGEENFKNLSSWINDEGYSKVFILTDDQVNENVVPKLLPQLAINCPFEIIEIESGEDQKTVETAYEIWNILAEFNADRQALLLNVGGGMITDLGGFVAATYKRGIDFVNIPTSLLAMVDASVGGKNGVNLGYLKNMVGTFSNPKRVCIDVSFLETLPGNQLRSGLAEMYKHGLIADESYWKQLMQLDQLTTDDLTQLIYFSVYIKNEFVKADPNEKNVRKALNFGHTLGHAIETYSYQKTDFPTLLHGEAIAIGMILESYLSYKKGLISFDVYTEIENNLNLMFETVAFSKNDIDICIQLLQHDKKNKSTEIKFVLLENIGQFVIDQTVTEQWIYEAFDRYLSKI